MRKKLKMIRILAFSLVILFFLNLGTKSSIIGKTSIENPFSSIGLNNSDKENWEFTPVEVVSTVTSGGSIYPSIAIDSKESIHVVWTDYGDYLGSGTDGAVLHSVWEEETQDWSTAYFVSEQCDLSSYKPIIAIDSKDNLHVVWEDISDYAGAGASDADVFYRCWNATTQIWQTTEVVSSESTDHSFAPYIVIDNHDNPVVAWYDETNYLGAGGDTDIFYKQKDILLGTWRSVTVVSTVSSSPSIFPAVAIDSKGYIHFVWSDEENYLSAGLDSDIFYRIHLLSEDMWSTTEVLSSVSGAASELPKIVIDTKDDVHICWEDNEDYFLAGSDKDIFYRRYVDTLSSWDVIEVVSSGFEGTSQFYDISMTTMLVDSINNVHFVWMDYSDYGPTTDWDILYKVLYIDKNQWSKVMSVTFDQVNSPGGGTIAINSADHVIFAWDDQLDILGSGLDDDIFLRKFAGPPDKPILQPIVPNPSESDQVELTWEAVPGVTQFILYRSTEYISSIDGLTALSSISSANYTDTLSSEGIYYYVLVAENQYGLSYLSNCEYVQYNPPHVREFASIIAGVVTGIAVVAAGTLVFIKKKK